MVNYYIWFNNMLPITLKLIFPHRNYTVEKAAWTLNLRVSKTVDSSKTLCEDVSNRHLQTVILPTVFILHSDPSFNARCQKTRNVILSQCHGYNSEETSLRTVCSHNFYYYAMEHLLQ